MKRNSRRSFLGTAAAIPFAVWLEQQAFGAGPTTRYNAVSTQGQAMIKIYAEAVKKMQGTAEGNPLSWTFEWYTHFVTGTSSKAAELARIYPNPSDPNKALAQAAWNTCQPHSAGQDTRLFLPWHRMFVYYFESIIRSVSGHPEFTLPYWNYSVTGSLHGVMPASFRNATDPVLKVLLVDGNNPVKHNRNTGVNAGTPIDKGQPGNPLSLDSLKQCKYEQTSRTVTGFCNDLDNGLHGNVHVLTGNSGNMGQIPNAAYDPVFWMHHCNIDRLWASWNKAGRQNPTDPAFLATSFTFADANGHSVTSKVSDVMSISQLNYTYDAFEPVPACPPQAAATAAGGEPVTRVSLPPTAFALGAATSRTRLQAAAVSPTAAAAKVSTTLAGTKRRLYLVIKDLKADAAPGVLYHVYLELPEGADALKNTSNYVGAINFFDAVGHDHGAEHDNSARFYSFDITALVKKLGANKQLTDQPSIAIAPAGTPAAEAKPVVGSVSIVEF